MCIRDSSNINKNKLISTIDGYKGNAYEIKIYTAKGGTELGTFNITLDATTIKTQKGVENLVIDETEIVF